MPVMGSLTGAAVNVALKFALMGSLAQVGLALATSVGAWVNLLLVLTMAWRAGYLVPDAQLKASLAKLLAAAIALAAALWLGNLALTGLVDPAAPLRDEMRLLALIVIGGVIYGGAILLMFGRRMRTMMRG
jgi:putative peptidoglycan lipid II flippase